MPSMVPKKHWENFGAWVRQTRRMADLTQKRVAEKAGIHEVQVARIEKGESGTKRETVIALAKALGTDEAIALNKAGYALVEEDFKTRLIIPPYPKRPKNAAEFFEAIGNFGDFGFAADFSNFTEEDFEDLWERIKTDVQITIRRKNK